MANAKERRPGNCKWCAKGECWDHGQIPKPSGMPAVATAANGPKPPLHAPPKWLLSKPSPQGSIRAKGSFTNAKGSITTRHPKAPLRPKHLPHLGAPDGIKGAGKGFVKSSSSYSSNEWQGNNSNEWQDDSEVNVGPRRGIRGLERSTPSRPPKGFVSATTPSSKPLKGFVAATASNHFESPSDNEKNGKPDAEAMSGESMEQAYGFGYELMKKMGYEEGSGLGRMGQGLSVPLMPDKAITMLGDERDENGWKTEKSVKFPGHWPGFKEGTVLPGPISLPESCDEDQSRSKVSQPALIILPSSNSSKTSTGSSAPGMPVVPKATPPSMPPPGMMPGMFAGMAPMNPMAWLSMFSSFKRKKKKKKKKKTASSSSSSGSSSSSDENAKPKKAKRKRKDDIDASYAEKEPGVTLNMLYPLPKKTKKKKKKKSSSSSSSDESDGEKKTKRKRVHDVDLDYAEEDLGATEFMGDQADEQQEDAGDEQADEQQEDGNDEQFLEFEDAENEPTLDFDGTDEWMQEDLEAQQEDEMELDPYGFAEAELQDMEEQAVQEFLMTEDVQQLAAQDEEWGVDV